MTLANNPFKAYTYLIGWSDRQCFYYGVRYARGCHPSELFVTYFTSSKKVRAIHSELGEPDVIQIRRKFDDISRARNWEHKVLRRIKATTHPKLLNQTDNKSICPEASLRGATKPRSESFKQKCRGRLSPRKGKSSSDLTRAKQSITHKRRGVWYNNTTVEQKFPLDQQPPGFTRGRIYKLPSRKGIKDSAETRAKKSANQKGRIAWNKGINMKTRSSR